jgi:glycosyltransferase involved in cell wall biosynthesis
MLSVITVNLNNDAGLEKTIKSVINQSFRQYEYIIIDGESSDDSLNIIKKYSDLINY